MDITTPAHSHLIFADVNNSDSYLDNVDTSSSPTNEEFKICQTGEYMKKYTSRGNSSKKWVSISKDYSRLSWQVENKVSTKKSFSFIYCGGVRRGINAYLSKKGIQKTIESSPEKALRIFSLYCSALRDPIILECKTENQCDRWVRVIEACINKTNSNTKRSEWFSVSSEWDDSDKSSKSILTILRRHNIKITKREILAIFSKVSDSNRSTFDLKFEEFLEIHMKLMHRKEFQPLYERYSRPSEKNASLRVMNIDDLNQFLKSEQDEDLSREDVEELVRRVFEINRVETGMSSSSSALSFTKSEFICYLHSPFNYIVDQSNFSQRMDMTHPITDYFIASSHNTYLENAQYKGNSSVQMYKNALINGCKCVEIDCWDGSNNNPIVYHGYTFTQKIQFFDVIRTISKHAFDYSSYPLIISLENHCNSKQQLNLCTMINTTLKEKLAVRTEKDLDKVYSPEELKGKILIKGNYTTAIPDLKKLIFLRSKKFDRKQLDLMDSSADFRCDIRTFSEKNIYKIQAQCFEKFKDYSKSMLHRCYPGYNRVHSSNYNPVSAWSIGCQMVALNYQTVDKAMILQNGLFALNGGCGYVLKPASYRKDSLSRTSISLSGPNRSSQTSKQGVSKVADQNKKITDKVEAPEAKKVLTNGHVHSKSIKDESSTPLEKENVCTTLVKNEKEKRNETIKAAYQKTEKHKSPQQNGESDVMRRKTSRNEKNEHKNESKKDSKKERKGTKNSTNGLKIDAKKEGATKTAKSSPSKELKKNKKTEHDSKKEKEHKKASRKELKKEIRREIKKEIRHMLKKDLKRKIKKFESKRRSSDNNKPDKKLSKDKPEKLKKTGTDKGEQKSADGKKTKKDVKKTRSSGDKASSEKDVKEKNKSIKKNNKIAIEKNQTEKQEKPEKKNSTAKKDSKKTVSEEKENKRGLKTLQSLPLIPQTKTKYRIEIISGSQLPKNKTDNEVSKVINPFVQVDVYGCLNDKIKRRTKTIMGNGFNPVWQEVFEFSVDSSSIEIAMILFRVFSESPLKGKTLLAANSFPLHLIKTGYRFIPLKNKYNDIISRCGLYCCITFNK